MYLLLPAFNKHIPLCWEGVSIHYIPLTETQGRSMREITYWYLKARHPLSSSSIARLEKLKPSKHNRHFPNWALDGPWLQPYLVSHPQLKAINHSLFLAFCPPAGQMQSRGRFSLVQIEAKSAFNVKLGGKRRRTNGTRCYRGRIGRFWQGFLPFRSASTNSVFSWFQPLLCSTQHHFASEETFLGISTFAQHPHYPSSIQHPGERHIVSHSELISSESLGSEGLEGKAWNLARPLVLKSSPYRSWCESISCGDLSTSISPFQPPLLYETLLVTFTPALTSPVSGLGRSVFALRWQLWCTRRTPQAARLPVWEK